jgi:hypothetical protein
MAIYREFVGIRTVYLSTSPTFAARIYAGRGTSLMTNGPFGPAIYFNDCELDARLRSHSDGVDAPVIIVATVDFGTALVWEQKTSAFDLPHFQRSSCDSIKSRLRPSLSWLYVSFNQSAVRLQALKGTIPHGPTSVAALSELSATQWLHDIALSCSPRKETALSQIPPKYLIAHNCVHGGNCIVLSYLMTNDRERAIFNIALEHFDSKPREQLYRDRDGRRYKRLLVDFNSEGLGPFVYISFTLDRFEGMPPVAAIRAVKERKISQLPRGCEYVCWRGTREPANAFKGDREMVLWFVMEKW